MRFTLLLIAAVAAGLTAGAAPAAPVPATDVPAMTAAADIIVVGRVEGGTASAAGWRPPRPSP